MLDAYIIDALRREQEEEEPERSRLELPVPPPAPQPVKDEPAKDRVIIIEM